MLVFGVCGHQGWNQEIKMVEARIQAYWVWLTLLIIAIAVVFFVSSIIMPFVAGMAIAYFLDPLVDKLESIGLSRINSTICVICSFFIVVILILILIFPLLQNQFIGFVDKIPSLIQNFQTWLAPYKEVLVSRITSDKLQEISGVSGTYGGHAIKWLGDILRGILQGGLVIFNTLSLVLVTPVVTFYLLRDWDVIVSKIDGWLPREFAPSIRVNCIAPSLTDSKISQSMLKSEVVAEALAKAHPLKRLGEGKDSACLAGFLLGEGSSWVTGQIIGVDGGRSRLS